MSLDIQPPVVDQGGKVFDIADPELHGKVLKAGPEISEVRFDDGAQRYVTNVHLRVVDDGLSQLNPSPTAEIVRLGQEAMARKRHRWDDWLAIAEALQVGRTEVMHALHTNQPSGRRYEKAISEWLIAHSFKEIDKATRKRLLDCLKHKTEIEAWRARLTDAERFKFNHPDTVLRKWKASTGLPDPNAPPRISPIQKLKDELVNVVEERDRYKREVARGGGDLWDAKDRPEDIAHVIVARVGRGKANRIAQEIIKAVKPHKSGIAHLVAPKQETNNA